jgi:hypothetical protein
MAWTTPGTATAGEVLTASFWNTQVRDNMVELAPFSAAWTSWTPTWTNLTVGNGILTARYVKVGKFVAFNLQLVFGSTTAITGTDVSASVPVSQAAANGVFSGSGLFLDTGTAVIPAFVEISGGQIYMRGIRTDATYASWALLTTTVPFTWTTNDAIRASGIYEAA